MSRAPREAASEIDISGQRIVWECIPMYRKVKKQVRVLERLGYPIVTAKQTPAALAGTVKLK